MFAENFFSWLRALYKPDLAAHPTPRQRGFADYESGQLTNPFPEGSPQSEEWKAGCQDAWNERQW